MRLTILGILFSLSGCGAEPQYLADILRERGDPLVVATDYEFAHGTFRTIYLYGLTTAPFAPLSLNSDRYLVYTDDRRFSQHVGYHFKHISDPARHSGSTMFAKVFAAPSLEVIRVDSNGRFRGRKNVQVDVAYLEVGTKGHLIRRKIQTEKPNKAPEPTPGLVTPRALE